MRIRSTFLKKFYTNPEKIIAEIQGLIAPDEPTGSMILGTIMHEYLFENIKNFEEKTKGKGKEFSKNEDDKILLNPDTIDLVEDIKKAVTPFLEKNKLLENSEIEKDFRCDYGFDHFLTAKPDVLKDGYIYDLKTVGGINWRSTQEGWSWAYEKNLWDIQLAHYSMVLKNNGYDIKGGVFICVSKDKPHQIACIKINKEKFAQEKHVNILENFIKEVEKSAVLEPKYFTL